MIHAIIASASNGVIGKNNLLPWHIPQDLKLFKQLTTDHAVVMGRKTFDSLNMVNGLPNRHNIVLTRNANIISQATSVEFIDDIDIVLSHFDNNKIDNCFVIGGCEIYKMFMPYIHTLHISNIKRSYEGDTNSPFDSTYLKYFTLNESTDYDEFVHNTYVRF